jgi:hypothetical protein
MSTQNKTNPRSWATAFLLLGLATGLAAALQQRLYLDAGKGQPPFDVTHHAVPLSEIVPAGPPKDGIPALENPKFVPATEAHKFLGKHDRVLGVEYNGIAKAYPVKILNWHEIVNDDCAGKPVAVTW